MDETRSLGDDLARTIRRLYERGLVSGVGGNASALLRSGDEFLITPASYFKGGVARGDLVRVGIGGKVIGRGRPSSELATHMAAYKTRDDVRAVVHGHPPSAVGLASAGVRIPIMTPEHAVMIGEMDVVDFAVPGEEGAKAIAAQLERCDVIGIKNHGFFSLGKDLHEAASRLEVLEESSKIYLASRAVGGAPGLSGRLLKRTREAYRHG